MRSDLFEKKEWSAVKIIIKAIISGDPISERIDEHYNDDTSFYEESIRLIHAESWDQAYEIAGEVTLNESCQSYTNIYGQKVEWTIVESIDCFILSDKPVNKIKVYSNNYICPINKKDAQFIKEKYDFILDNDGKNEKNKRRQISKQYVLHNEEVARLLKKNKD